MSIPWKIPGNVHVHCNWKILEDLVTLQQFLTASCRRGAIQQPEECPAQAPKKGNQQISSISWPISHHHSSGNHPRMSETNQGNFILLYVCLPVVKQRFQPGNLSSPTMPKASKISTISPQQGFAAPGVADIQLQGIEISDDRLVIPEDTLSEPSEVRSEKVCERYVEHDCCSRFSLLGYLEFGFQT